jgi:hypothetical protein
MRGMQRESFPSRGRADIGSCAFTPGVAHLWAFFASNLRCTAYHWKLFAVDVASYNTAALSMGTCVVSQPRGKLSYKHWCPSFMNAALSNL